MNQAEWKAIETRLDRIENALGAIANRPPEDRCITREQLSAQLDLFKDRVEEDVNARFERQSLLIEALRSMIRHTDSLLERVLAAIGED